LGTAENLVKGGEEDKAQGHLSPLNGGGGRPAYKTKGERRLREKKRKVSVGRRKERGGGPSSREESASWRRKGGGCSSQGRGSPQPWGGGFTRVQKINKFSGGEERADADIGRNSATRKNVII